MDDFKFKIDQTVYHKTDPFQQNPMVILETGHIGNDKIYMVTMAHPYWKTIFYEIELNGESESSEAWRSQLFESLKQ